MKKILLTILMLTFAIPVYAGVQDWQRRVKGDSSNTLVDGRQGNSLDIGWDTWNFEESAGSSLTSYAKGSAGIVYGWEITGLSSDSSGWAKLYDAASIVGSIGEKSELTIDGTYKDSDYRIFPFGVLFSTEIVVQRSSATAVNVIVWYK